MSSATSSNPKMIDSNFAMAFKKISSPSNIHYLVTPYSLIGRGDLIPLLEYDAFKYDSKNNTLLMVECSKKPIFLNLIKIPNAAEIMKNVQLFVNK